MNQFIKEEKLGNLDSQQKLWQFERKKMIEIFKNTWGS